MSAPQQRQQSAPGDGGLERSNNNPELYPDVLSARPVIFDPSLSREETILVLHDVIVRSLRRRLWKAFQEDDKETALRAYQATFIEFQQWLEHEDEVRMQMAQAEDLNRQQANGGERSKEKRTSFLAKRRSLRALESPGTSPGNSNGRPHHTNKGGSKRNLRQHDAENQERSLLMHCQTYEKELQHKFGGLRIPILETLMNPSEPFIADDFLSPYDRYEQPAQKEFPDPVRYAAEQQALEDARMQRRSARRPRVAFRRMFKRDGTPDIEAAPTATSGDSAGPNGATNISESIYMTTPLHEAARLGAGDFVAFLLVQGGDPNLRNGFARTSLHTCAGGLTLEEQQLSEAWGRMSKKADHLSSNDSAPVGIRATFLPDEVLRLMHVPPSTSTNEIEKKTTGREGQPRGIFGRLFRPNHLKKDDGGRDQETIYRKQTSSRKPNPVRSETLTADRMDAALAILTWVQKDTGDGPSINAVDADGRTALHYASGMGRSDICMAILSNFGAMLTIVDEVGARTPCEVASSQGYKGLAAQLEARALLYLDPYGLDDDLMENMVAVGGGADSRQQLVPPFKWFQTLSVQEVTNDRYERVSQARNEMLGIIDRIELAGAGENRKARSSFPSSTESSSSDSPTDDSDDDQHCIHLQNSTDAKDLGKRGDIPVDSDSNIQYLRRTFLQLQDSHVEAFLSFHKWDVAGAIMAFRQDKFDAFLNAGVPLPSLSNIDGKTGERMCQICYDDVAVDEWMNLHGCEHGFCKDCLFNYIQDCAKDKQPMHSICCPHHECSSYFSKHNIEMLLKNDSSSLQRLYEATTENYVTTSADLKFCPFPGCEGIVHRLPQSKFSNGRLVASFLDYTGATCVAVRDRNKIGDGCTLTYEGVEDLEYNNCHSTEQPPKAHRFCFSCGESVHWPLTCERLDKWNEKVREEIGEVVDENGDGDLNDLAQKLWIKANTRPCPSCNVNIEKNDGCNHMICSNPQCLHEFCWICRKDWKLHSNATGGFFRCNIWEEDEGGEEHVQELIEANPFDPTNEEGYGTAIHSAREAWKTKQETNRFIHHYTRWEAHAQSASLERKMQDSVCTRLAPVVEAAMAFDGSPVFNFGGQGLSFIHSAFTELLECRSVLRHSYAFSYFRYPTFSRSAHIFAHLYGKRKEKQNFERLQAELEVLTEQMSDIVARSHLRATQIQIAFLTAGAAEKRVELTNLVFQIYKDEKKEMERYKKQKEREEKRSKASAGILAAPDNTRPSLSELMAMHHRPRDRPFDESGLSEALDDFLARAGGMEHRSRLLGEVDDLASEAVRMWACPRCTFMNEGGRLCAMCGSRR